MRSSTITMPLHFAATKYALSVRTKHWALAAARSFSDFPSWESVSSENVEDTAEELREHRDGVPGHALSLASSSWHCRPSPQGVLSDNGVAAAQAGGAGASCGRPCHSRQEGAFRSNAEREPLVPSQPIRPHDAASLLHQCAAVLRSGRVCGGHHPGAECRDRRQILPADADELGLRPEPAATHRVLK